MTQAPPSTHDPVLKPHRGAVVLTLGIVGLVFSTACGFIVGIIAWVMGNADLKEMDAGRMDPSGRGLTQAGKICGIISTVIGALGLVVGLLWILLVVVIGITGAAAGAGAGGP